MTEKAPQSEQQDKTFKAEWQATTKKCYLISSSLFFRSCLLPCKFIHLMSWLNMSFYLLPSSLDERTNFFLSSTFSSPPLRRQKPNIAYFCLGNWLLDLSYFLCFCKSKLIAQMFFTITNEKRIFFVCMLFYALFLPSASAPFVFSECDLIKFLILSLSAASWESWNWLFYCYHYY